MLFPQHIHLKVVRGRNGSSNYSSSAVNNTDGDTLMGMQGLGIGGGVKCDVTSEMNDDDVGSRKKKESVGGGLVC